MQHTLSVTVEDKPGVLARVSAMFSNRGFNIHSLAVGPPMLRVGLESPWSWMLRNWSNSRSNFTNWSMSSRSRS